MEEVFVFTFTYILSTLSYFQLEENSSLPISVYQDN